MAVVVGVKVGHRIDDKYDVVTEIESATCCRFNTNARSDARQDNLGYAALTQVIIQRSADECAPSLLADGVVLGMPLQFRNKVGPIRRKRKLGTSGISAAWST